MSFSQRMHPIRAAYEARISDGKYFVKKILIPQIFTLVFFILIGAFLSEEPRSLLIRLLSLVYPAVFTLWIASTGSVVSLRFVAIYLGLFSLLLSSALIFLSLNPILLFYGPIAVLIVALYPLALPYHNVLLSVLPSLLIIFLSELIRFFINKQVEHSALAASIVSAISIFLLLVISKIIRMRGWLQQKNQSSANYNNLNQIRSGLHKDTTAIVEAARWLMGFRHAWNIELAREALWRQMLIAISSQTLLTIAYTYNAIPHYVAGLMSVALVVFHGILLSRLRGDAPKDGVLGNSLIFVIGSFLPSLLVIGIIAEAPLFYKVLYLIVFSLSIAIIPLNIKSAAGLSILLITNVVFVFSDASLIFAAIIISTLVQYIAFKISIFSYLGIATRSAGNLLGRYCMLFRDPKEVMELYALTISEIGETSPPLLISSTGEAYTITSKENNLIEADLPLVQTFLHLIEDLQIDEGLIYVDKLSEQHRSLLLDSFDSIPNRLIYFTVNGVINEKEEKLAAIIPVSSTIRIYGLTRFLRSIAALFLPVKLSLSSIRGQYISTDHFATQQRSISEREEEINEMVHLVNNSAQDIAIHCEVIRQYLTQDEAKNLIGSFESIEDVFQQIMQVELCARTLSEGVSDIKLVRELMSLKNLDHVEVVPVRRLLEDLHNFANYRARRRGEEFNLISELKDDQGVKVASRDFMETVLRLLVRIAGRRIEGFGRVEVKVYREGDSITFLVRDNGKIIDEDARASIGLTFHPSHSGTHGEEYLRAVGDFARFSKGSFSFEESTSEYSNTMKLTLPVGELPIAKVVTPGQWALLVDDNRQVTTFYARVAEALKLRYFTAVSVDEARSILTQEGKPRLVITDIQLDGSSGIDVVRDVRERFGKEVPIVVVSGQADDSLSRQVLQAGATKCLMKPVGRRKLFAEIEEIL